MPESAQRWSPYERTFGVEASHVRVRRGLMTSGRKTVRTVARSRCVMSGLEVSGDLLGASMNFKYDGRFVKIKIPDIMLNDHMDVSVEDYKKASLVSYIPSDLQLRTCVYAIAWIEVSMPVSERINVPEEMMKVPLKALHIAGRRLSERLDKLVLEYERRLADACAAWEDTIKWLSGSSSLGTPGSMPGHDHPQDLQFTCFESLEHGHRFWTPPGRMELTQTKQITRALWDAAATTLTAGNRAPTWFRYLDDAYRRFVGRDLNGAILSVAVSCETLCREVFSIVGGISEAETVREIIDRIVSVPTILDHWTALTKLPKSDANVDRVRHIFKLRNGLMHAGGKGL